MNLTNAYIRSWTRPEFQTSPVAELILGKDGSNTKEIVLGKLDTQVDTHNTCELVELVFQLLESTGYVFLSETWNLLVRGGVNLAIQASKNSSPGYTYIHMPKNRELNLGHKNSSQQNKSGISVTEMGWTNLISSRSKGQLHTLQARKCRTTEW